MSSRSRFRRVGALTIAVLSVFSVASTTVAGSTAAGGTATGPVPDVDPEGILNFGAALVSGVGVAFDPTYIQTELPNIYWVEMIFGTLGRMDENGVVQPWMAEGLEVVDPQTIRITLRPDMTFTDGAPYDAEAVAAGLLRTRFESADATVESRMDPGFKALESAEVIDPLTVEVHLDRAIPGVFLDAIASVWGAIPSPKQVAEAPDQVNASPVGAGPYVFEEYLTDQRISVRKNTDFFEAEAWPLGGIDYLQTPNGPSQANGLLSGTIDANVQLPIEDLPVLEADGNYNVTVEPVRLTMLLGCPTKPPLDDLAVRQAIMLGIDREAYNDLVYGGRGAPAYGVVPPGSPSYDESLAEEWAHDPDRARQILADAGLSDVSYDLVTITTHNWGRNVEVIQSQLAEIGITANIEVMDDVYTNWIEPQAPGQLIAPVPGNRPGGWTFFNDFYTEGGKQAYCGLGDPEIRRLIDEAVALLPDSAEAIDLYRQADVQASTSLLQIPLLWEPYAMAINDSRVGGTPEFIDTHGYLRFRFESLYIKST